MRGSHLVLVALAAAVTLTSVAAAGPAAKKQRAAITVKFHDSTFVLSPFRAGALKRDSGTITDKAPNAPCREAIRDGQEVRVCSGRRLFTGKRGTLTIRTQEEWVNPGSDGCGVAFGTWKVVRGTGVYDGISGGGRSAYDAHCEKWYGRYEGFFTLPSP